MTRKIKSVLAGLLCLACLPVISVSVSAAEPYYLVITGVDDARGLYIAVDEKGDAFYLTDTTIAECLPEESMPLIPGDVVQFAEGVYGGHTELGGNSINHMTLFVPNPPESAVLTKIGSVLDDMETAVFTTGGEEMGLELYDDESTYRMITCWQYDDRYEKLGNVDFADVEPGDSLECIVYNGVPVIPLKVVSTTLDENGESDYDYEYYSEFRSVYRLYTDSFKYVNHGYHVKKNFTSDVYYKHGEFRTDLVNANYLVTGVFYAPGETKPAYYTVNEFSATVYYGYSMNVAADEIAYYLGDQILEIGDLLYIDFYNRSGFNPTDLIIHSEEGSVETIVEYAGNGVELFGADFRKVLRHELDKMPVLKEGRDGYHFSTANNPFEKGKVTDDEDVDLLDVIALNKHLMTGRDISYIGMLSADVDNNGVVDEVDSLNILKSIIGLVDLNELS